MFSQGWTHENERLRGIGNTPPVEVKPPVQPEPTKTEGLQSTYSEEFSQYFRR